MLFIFIKVRYNKKVNRKHLQIHVRKTTGWLPHSQVFANTTVCHGVTAAVSRPLYYQEDYYDQLQKSNW